MGLKLLHPQEVEVFYILPGLRSELARIFKADGWSQAMIARVMGVTEPAVSQYLRDKRATGITFTPEVKQLVKIAAAKIKDQQSFVYHTQQLLNHLLTSRITCDIHQRVADVPHDCDTCFNCK